ncbi:hypothetical protein DFP73DRAFT_528571 [Morchella snyderi]|nr:hypothetical protein DFP73DRAFT_528571 [Morchella snyderi]
MAAPISLKPRGSSLKENLSNSALWPKLGNNALVVHMPSRSAKDEQAVPKRMSLWVLFILVELGAEVANPKQTGLTNKRDSWDEVMCDKTSRKRVCLPPCAVITLSPSYYLDLVPTDAIQCLVVVRCTWCMELQLISHRMIANGKDNAEVIVDGWTGEKKSERQDECPAVPITLQRELVAVYTVPENFLPSYMSRCIGSSPIPDGYGVRHSGLRIVKELGGHETELAFPGARK